MIQLYEIIAQFTNEKRPLLPPICGYYPWPEHTYQGLNKELVYTSKSYSNALVAFKDLKSLSFIALLTMYHGGEIKKEWKHSEYDFMMYK